MFKSFSRNSSNKVIMEGVQAENSGQPPPVIPPPPMLPPPPVLPRQPVPQGPPGPPVAPLNPYKIMASAQIGSFS